MESPRTIPFANGFAINEQSRAEAELTSRRAAITDALKSLSEEITKTDGIGKVGYAGIALGSDPKELMQQAISDIKMQSPQTIKHLFLYIEIDGGMKMSELAELNNVAKNVAPQGVAHSQVFSPAQSDNEKKVVAIAF